MRSEIVNVAQLRNTSASNSHFGIRAPSSSSAAGSGAAPRTPPTSPGRPGNNNNSSGRASRSVFDDFKYIAPDAAMQEENDAEFYAQNYGIKLAMEQLNAIMEVLTNGSSSLGAFPPAVGSVKAQKLAKVSFAKDESEELHTVEELRMNIQKHIALIREMHFIGLNVKHVRKDLQKEVDDGLKECDKLRNELLQEVEGSHWPVDMKAGQYEAEIETTKAVLKELKKEAKQWDHKVSLKRVQNIRLSQIITADSARRVTAVMTKKMPPIAEHSAATGAAVAAGGTGGAGGGGKSGFAHTVSAVVSQNAERRNSHSVLDAALEAIEQRYTIANKRISIFDDMSNIYDTTMANIRAVDSTVPPPLTFDGNSAVVAAPVISSVNKPAGGATVITTGSDLNKSSNQEVSDDVASNNNADDSSNTVSPATAVTLPPSSITTTVVGAATSAAQVMLQYEGYEEDQALDGWEDILNGYEGDKSDVEFGI